MSATKEQRALDGEYAYCNTAPTPECSPALSAPLRSKQQAAMDHARATLRVIALCAADMQAREAAERCLADIATLVGTGEER